MEKKGQVNLYKGSGTNPIRASEWKKNPEGSLRKL